MKALIKFLFKLVIAVLVVMGCMYATNLIKASKHDKSITCDEHVDSNVNDTITVPDADSVMFLLEQRLPNTITAKQITELIQISNHAKDVGIQHPEIFLAQVILETNWLTSDAYKHRNNISGMHKAYQRPTTRIQDSDSTLLATYSTVKASVYDYKIWQNEYGHDLTEDEYYQLLQDIYSENHSYSDTLRILRNYAKLIFQFS